MAPAVVQITPGSAYNNTVIDRVNLTGKAFLPGTVITLNGTGFEDIRATNVTVVSGVLITCSFNLTGIPAGSRNVVVTNTDGKEGMLVDGFSVHAGSCLTPGTVSGKPDVGICPAHRTV